MSKFLTAAYFIVFMLPTIILIPITILLLCDEIKDIISTEASKNNIGFLFIILICFIFSLPMLVPKFRMIFKKLPWLYAYIIIALLDMFLISTGILIINYGYEVKNPDRYFTYLVLMAAWMVVGRLGICLYYKAKPMKYEGDENDE